MTSAFGFYEAIDSRPDLQYPRLRRPPVSPSGWDRGDLAPPIDAPHPNLPREQQAIEEQLSCLGRRQRPLGFHPAAEFFIQPLDGVGAAQEQPISTGLRRNPSLTFQDCLVYLSFPQSA